jgi:glycosyltransferase involved in cell wall biosynthesis
MTQLNLPAYEVVIATRNRAGVLSVSIPTLLRQSVSPARVLVVDASDDPKPVRRAIDEINRRYGANVELLTGPRGGPLQRNLGLATVRAPVVFFPDDDSLWHPGSAEAILRVYARDGEKRIGGVCAAQASSAPTGSLDHSAATLPYRMRWPDRIKNCIGPWRAKIEHALVPDPFILHGRREIRRLGVPSWLAEEDAVPVEWMTGFRMTFRTDVVRQVGFERTFENYSVFDDVELCFAVMRTHLLVGANRAAVFHYREPGARSDPALAGVRQILDRAYVLRKHADVRALAGPLRRFHRLKLLQYMAGATTSAGRGRFAGAWRAVRRQPEMLNSAANRVAETYRRLRAELAQPPTTTRGASA